MQWPTNSITRMGSSPLTRGKRAVALSRRASTGLIPAHAGKTAVRLMLRRNRWAHPRSRGENYVITRDSGKPAGSSPLTRGKQGLHLAVSVSSGLIPAHAGKTPASPPEPRHAPAHPRSRGENKVIGQGYSGAWGSSPLTRGKPVAGSGAMVVCRLIPAHAGKTFPSSTLRGQSWAHPRSRGENKGTDRSAYLNEGSSPLTRGKRFAAGGQGPRPGLIPAHAGKTGEVLWTGQDSGGSSPLTRGKRLLGRRLRGVQRLIPAHAGKTCVRRRAAWPMTAHPRSRGENPHLGYVEVYAQGSSPLTRGKPMTTLDYLMNVGLIPAHAGKTRRQRDLHLLDRAHPRSRGENLSRLGCVMSRTGSSPLTRGKLSRRAGGLSLARLIPAHAGKTRSACVGSVSMRAHPRSRGENRWRRASPRRTGGSSPLTRGKHGQPVVDLIINGLIPAHAGKTCLPGLVGAHAEAHPRSRGENQDENIVNLSKQGSSPLTRGKLNRRRHGQGGLGLIPAHAGKTC